MTLLWGAWCSRVEATLAAKGLPIGLNPPTGLTSHLSHSSDSPAQWPMKEIPQPALHSILSYRGCTEFHHRLKTSSNRYYDEAGLLFFTSRNGSSQQLNQSSSFLQPLNPGPGRGRRGQGLFCYRDFFMSKHQDKPNCRTPE
ncbi:hypothetical protein QYF36_015998 [Acer negundo]|nr:hypothetical protein QYF36_015998 [Acer negundo]